MEFQKFKEEVSKHFRLSLNSYKEVQLKRRIDNIMSRNNSFSYSEYFLELKTNNDAYMEFKDYITINVSEFFRNPQIFEVLEKRILPDLVNARNRLKIWSAACSNGSEPYSIAMILEEIGGGKTYNIEATDLDENILSKAQRGVYSTEEIKNISKTRYLRFFNKDEDNHRIVSDLKNKIRFRKHDLLLDSYHKGYDLIVCRNVTIYFTKEAQDKIYVNFTNSLNVGGYLFIGGTENIFNYKELGLEKVSPCFYQKMQE